MPATLPSRATLLWAGALTFVLIGAAQALYGPTLPALSRRYGIDMAEAGLLLSAHAAGGLSALLTQLVRGNGSARPALGLIATGGGTLAWSEAWAVALLGAFCLGAGFALASTHFNRRFLAETGPRGPAMVGALNAMFGLGAILGPLALIGLGALGGSPREGFALVALLALLLVPLAGGRRADGAAGPEALPLGALKAHVGLLGVGALSVGLEAALVGLGPAALVTRGVSEAHATLLVSVFFAVFLAARLALVWLAPRLAPRTLLAAGFFGTAAAALLAAVGAPALAYAGAGATVGVLFPSYFVEISRALGGGERGAALAMIAVFVGAISVPAGMTRLLGHGDGAVFFPALALYCLLAGVAALRVRAA